MMSYILKVVNKSVLAIKFRAHCLIYQILQLCAESIVIIITAEK
jgi:hypothetical protein